MALITLEEAKGALRVDDDYWNDIINPLIETLPSYLLMKTGRAWDDLTPFPLAKTTAKFILQLWFEGPNQDDNGKLEKTIDNLLATLTALGRNMK